MQGEKLNEYKRLSALADAAYDAMEDVGLDLINTRPTTVAGILALCQYIAPLFGETEQPNLPQRTTTAPTPTRPKRLPMSSVDRLKT